MTFHIDCGTYEFGINFIIESDLKKACKWINFKLELPSDKNVKVNESDFSHSLGKRILINGYCPIVWLPKKPETSTELGTAIHEIFHAVCDCMRWADIELTNSSEEAYCHLIKHVTKNFF